MSYYVIFSLYHHVNFYKTLTSLCTLFIKGHVGFLQLLKCRTSVFLPMWSPTTTTTAITTSSTTTNSTTTTTTTNAITTTSE